jgi:transposase-like protein
MLSVIADDAAQGELRLELDELFREGARRMLAAALEAEVDAYLATHAAERDERGRRLVVRNGHAPARTITSGVGQVEVARPRVDDRRVDATTGARMQFHSMLLPRWCRRSPKVAEVLPLLYLHGLSGGDFVPALEAFFGTAAGLSASVITRLVEQWQAERAAFARRDLRGSTTCTAGPTGSTSTSASAARDGCAAWSSSGCVPMAARSWSPSPTASASRPMRGRNCCATCAGGECARRW